MIDARHCSICEAALGKDPRVKYCSRECRKEAARIRARAWYAEHRDDPGHKERVKAASRRNHMKVASDPELLAKHRAATDQWRSQNKDRISEQYRNWRVDNADRVRSKNNNRRARLKEVFVEEVDASEIWSRDRGFCQICGAQVDPAAEWPHPMSKTIDHIVPIAKGGSHSMSNVQLAHALCNLRKGDRVA